MVDLLRRSEKIVGRSHGGHLKPVARKTLSQSQQSQSVAFFASAFGSGVQGAF